MKAFVLAAGFGKRMGELTKERPKPMLPLGGRPLLDHALFQLHRLGVREAVINLHYKGDVIRRHMEAFPHFPVRFSEEKEILGTAGGLRTGMELFSDRNAPFLLINPDTLLIPSPEDRPGESLLPSNADACLYLAPAAPGSMETTFRLEEEADEYPGCGSLRGETGGGHFYIGLALVRPSSLLSLEPGEKGELGPLWLNSGDEGRLTGRVFRGKYYDAGTLGSFESLQNSWEIPGPLRKDWEDFVRGWGET